MKTIKDLWEKFRNLTRSNVFIWGFPSIALTLLIVLPVRFLALLFLGIWTLALIFNTDED